MAHQLLSFSATLAGNQATPSAVGFDAVVGGQDIRVTALGAFVDPAKPWADPRKIITLYDTTTQAVLATLTITLADVSGGNTTQAGQAIFKALPAPVTIPAGAGITLAVSGYATDNLMDDPPGTYQDSTPDLGRGLIALVGHGRSGAAGAFPAPAANSAYVAVPFNSATMLYQGATSDLTDIRFDQLGPGPILAHGTGTYDNPDVTNPDVSGQVDPNTNQYFMTYSAYSTVTGTWTLCFADSPDLYRWTRFAGNPASAPSGSDWYININGSVLWFAGAYGTRYYNWYQDQSATAMYLETSPDRVTWTQHRAVLSPPSGTINIFDFCVRPIVMGGGLEAWMGAAISGVQARQFFRSTSADGVAWTDPTQTTNAVCPNYATDRGAPSVTRAGNLLFLGHDGGPGTVNGYASSTARRVHFHASVDNGATWTYRENALALPSGCNSIFDSSLLIDPRPSSGLIHWFCASGPGLQADQGMNSDIYHFVGRLPYARPRRRS